MRIYIEETLKSVLEERGKVDAVLEYLDKTWGDNDRVYHVVITLWRAFDFAETKEGPEYWQDIATKVDELNEGNDDPTYKFLGSV